MARGVLISPAPGPVPADLSGVTSDRTRPNQLPIVNAVALGVILLSAIPVYIAQRIAGDAVTSSEAARP